MNTQQTQLQPIQRTLILTHGPVGAAVAEKLSAQLEANPALSHAIGIEQCDGADLCQAPIDAALAYISQISGREQLQAEGWSLTRNAELQLYLVMDALPSARTLLPNLLAYVSTLAHERLGIAVAPMLIWLVPESSAPAVADCLIQTEGLTQQLVRGAFAMSLANELGLELADSDGLRDRATALLWRMATTPLGETPYWLENYAQLASLNVLGFEEWGWSPAQVKTHLAQLWRAEVIAQWQASASETAATTASTQLLTELGLYPDALQSHLLETMHLTSPHPSAASWQLPWPWLIHDLVNKTQALTAADLPQQAGETISGEKTEALEEKLRKLVAVTPNGGLSLVKQTGDTLGKALVDMVDTLHAQAHQLEEDIQADFAHSNELMLTLEQGLKAWPKRPFNWLICLVSIWRWPRIILNYLHLRDYGARFYQTQSRLIGLEERLKRGEMAKQVYDQLIESSQRVASQADEALGMLSQVKESYLPASHIPDALIENGNLRPFPLATLHPLFEAHHTDMSLEADQMAKALGGLDTQLVQLDDFTLKEQLLSASSAALQWVDTVSTATLLQVIHGEGDALHQWWEMRFDAAAPLWRFDTALLPEATRENTALLSVIGSDDVPMMRLLSQEAEPTVETDDDHIRHLTLAHQAPLSILRFRSGITSEAMIRTS